MTRETANLRMNVGLNSRGTAHFDPRPAVASFLQAKEPFRRTKLPDDTVQIVISSENSFRKITICDVIICSGIIILQSER